MEWRIFKILRRLLSRGGMLPLALSLIADDDDDELDDDNDTVVDSE
jgi:hypothetical protein